MRNLLQVGRSPQPRAGAASHLVMIIGPFTNEVNRCGFIIDYTGLLGFSRRKLITSVTPLFRTDSVSPTYTRMTRCPRYKLLGLRHRCCTSSLCLNCRVKQSNGMLTRTNLLDHCVKRARFLQ